MSERPDETISISSVKDDFKDEIDVPQRIEKLVDTYSEVRKVKDVNDEVLVEDVVFIAKYLALSFSRYFPNVIAQFEHSSMKLYDYIIYSLNVEDNYFHLCRIMTYDFLPYSQEGKQGYWGNEVAHPNLSWDLWSVLPQIKKEFIRRFSSTTQQ